MSLSQEIIENTSKINFFDFLTFFDLTAVNSISGLKSILKKFLKDLLQYFNPYIIKKLDLIDKIFLHSAWAKNSHVEKKGHFWAKNEEFSHVTEMKGSKNSLFHLATCLAVHMRGL